jgi:hypothetical protein
VLNASAKPAILAGAGAWNVNPDEPPLPGKVEYKQALKFAEAFLRGQSCKATTLFRAKIDQLKS